MSARTSLEVLVLALVARGLATPYDLHSKAGISIAASIPVLQRLKRAGLMESRKGPRRSQRFTVTPAGMKALRAEIPRLAKQPPPDIESVLRITYLLWTTAKKAGQAKSFLRRAAADRRRIATERRSEAEELHSQTYPRDRGFGHRWLRALVAAAQLEAEAETLLRLSARLPPA